jgi:hypothetical protein
MIGKMSLTRTEPELKTRIEEGQEGKRFRESIIVQ